MCEAKQNKKISIVSSTFILVKERVGNKLPGFGVAKKETAQTGKLFPIRS